jgi:hypothetical protein
VILCELVKLNSYEQENVMSFLEKQKKAHETRQTGAQVQELAVKFQRLCANELSETGVGQLRIRRENVANGETVP